MFKMTIVSASTPTGNRTVLYTDCRSFYRVSTVSAERIAAPFGRYAFENTTVLVLTAGGLPPLSPCTRNLSRSSPSSVDDSVMVVHNNGHRDLQTLTD